MARRVVAVFAGGAHRGTPKRVRFWWQTVDETCRTVLDALFRIREPGSREDLRRWEGLRGTPAGAATFLGVAASGARQPATL